MAMKNLLLRPWSRDVHVMIFKLVAVATHRIITQPVITAQQFQLEQEILVSLESKLPWK